MKTLQNSSSSITYHITTTEDWTLNISRYALPPIGENIPPLDIAIQGFKSALERAQEAEGRLRSNYMQVSFSIPESQFFTESPEDVTKKIRVYAAPGLYQSGELSIGAACELAGVDRYGFLDFCKREGVTLHTQTPKELEAEFKRFGSVK